MLLAEKSFTFFMWVLLTPCAFANGVPNSPPPGYATATEFCATLNNSAVAGISNTGSAWSTSQGNVSLSAVNKPNHVQGGANPSMDLKGSAYSDGKALTSGAGIAGYSGSATGKIDSVQTKNMQGIGKTAQHGTVNVQAGTAGIARNGQGVNGAVESITAVNAVSTLSLPKIGIADVKGALVQGVNNGGEISGTASSAFVGSAGR